MFNINDYVVYKKDVCKVKSIYKNKLNGMDYYVLIPVIDDSLRIDIPTNNRNNHLRSVITKKEVDEIIKDIPNISIIETNEKLMENEYKKLMSTYNHRDLIKIIKTTYLRNQNRLLNKKKISDRDNHYFMEAEKILYTEFSIVLGLSFDDTKNYIVNKIENR